VTPLQRNLFGESASIQAGISRTQPPISYVLEQAPPDNWIPLVPIQTPTGVLMFWCGTLENTDREQHHSAATTQQQLGARIPLLPDRSRHHANQRRGAAISVTLAKFNK
jgi:hypothetical protein